MKLFKLIIIFIILMLLVSCSEDSTNGNNPPTIPQIIYPQNEQHNLPISIELNWECSDEDGDDLKFIVFLSKTEELEIIAENINETSFVIDSLDYSQKYYWKISASDGEEETDSVISCFYTEAANNPPNVPQNIYPSGNATNIPNIVELRWECEDSDGDDLTYDVYLGTTRELVVIASEISETSFTPDTLDYSQSYYWKVQANDGEDSTSSAVWSFFTEDEDIPPSVPINPCPADSLTDTEIAISFRWYSYDVNGDDIVYDFYLGTDNNPTLTAENLTEMEYYIDNLDYHTLYYWQVVAKSEGMETEGPVWCFETRYENYPPNSPDTAFPYDGSEDVSTGANLNWNCTDPEGDDLVYDIYLGTDSDPPLVHQNYSSTTYQPETLEPVTTYYWRIVACDGNNYTHGPVWSMTTGNSNLPPNEPSLPLPEDNAVEVSISTVLHWVCSDPDDDTLMYKVYFGITPDLTEEHVIAMGITEANLELATLNYGTTYYWKITAHDGELLTTGPTWSFMTEYPER